MPAKGKPNQIVFWSRLPDWKNPTLTPNPDVIYLMPAKHYWSATVYNRASHVLLRSYMDEVLAKLKEARM